MKTVLVDQEDIDNLSIALDEIWEYFEEKQLSLAESIRLVFPIFSLVKKHGSVKFQEKEN